jgi:hypothetical protein
MNSLQEPLHNNMTSHISIVTKLWGSWRGRQDTALLSLAPRDCLPSSQYQYGSYCVQYWSKDRFWKSTDLSRAEYTYSNWQQWGVPSALDYSSCYMHCTVAAALAYKSTELGAENINHFFLSFLLAVLPAPLSRFSCGWAGTVARWSSIRPDCRRMIREKKSSSGTVGPCVGGRGFMSESTSPGRELRWSSRRDPYKIMRL